MENKINNEKQAGGIDSPNDCNCEGNCCPPKKQSPVKKIIFAFVILIALGITAFKLINPSTPVAAKEACCSQGSSVGCDTTKTAACDTAKGSTCCPK